MQPLWSPISNCLSMNDLLLFCPFCSHLMTPFLNCLRPEEKMLSWNDPIFRNIMFSLKDHHIRKKWSYREPTFSTNVLTEWPPVSATILLSSSPNDPLFFGSLTFFLNDLLCHLTERPWLGTPLSLSHLNGEICKVCLVQCTYKIGLLYFL